MKIVIAMDSFKGSLSAPEACSVIGHALQQLVPEAQMILKPMADGGEGTAKALQAARGGEWIEATVMGPLPDTQVSAGYAWIPDREAVVEMAQASGLPLLMPDELNPLRTTTYGTGQLIRLAVERGAKRIRLAVGGSATVDGGVGAAMALGWRFLDASGQSVPLGGEALGRIQTIDGQEALHVPPVEVLCDVNSPLCGPEGAARVYGPQKGATPSMVELLDDHLAHLAVLAEKQLGKKIRDVPGAGAAGGLAAGALAFMDARLVPGIETVMTASGLPEEVRDADWVITGEGRFDGQSLRGKVVSGVLDMARASGTRVAVLAGSVEVDEEQCRAAGISAVLASKPTNMVLDEALRRAEVLLAGCAERFARENLC